MIPFCIISKLMSPSIANEQFEADFSKSHINHRQAYHLEIVLIRRARSKTFDKQHDEYRGQK